MHVRSAQALQQLRQMSGILSCVMVSRNAVCAGRTNQMTFHWGFPVLEEAFVAQRMKGLLRPIATD